MLFPTSELNEIFKNLTIFKGIISIWGDFGVGKTTFSLQTAINSSTDKKNIIYIYSKPDLPLRKINRITSGTKDKLSNIVFIQIFSFDDLYNIIYNLEFLILKNIELKKKSYALIVIDSLTDLYRLALNKEKKEKNYNLNYNLNQILATLFFINNCYDIEILIVNEKVNKLVNNQIVETQSGGNVMEYWVSMNIKIERTQILKRRKFIINKYPEIQNIKYTYKLTQKGFERLS
ncbi:MAG: AAA family ATPase [Candidatus Thorarchaeota archaeon]